MIQNNMYNYSFIVCRYEAFFVCLFLGFVSGK